MQQKRAVRKKSYKLQASERHHQSLLSLGRSMGPYNARSVLNDRVFARQLAGMYKLPLADVIAIARRKAKR
jgi:hypothetical protein